MKKAIVFSMFFRIRRCSAMEAPRGPKIALKLPKMVPRRPRTRQDDPKSGLRGPHGIPRWLKSGPLGLQERSKKGHKRAPRGTESQDDVQEASKTVKDGSRSLQDGPRDSPNAFIPAPDGQNPFLSHFIGPFINDICSRYL